MGCLRWRSLEPVEAPWRRRAGLGCEGFVRQSWRKWEVVGEAVRRDEAGASALVVESAS
jgi:hypothetical protein